MTDTIEPYQIVRTHDPDTSYQAAEKVAPHLNRLQQIVLYWFEEHPEGLTDWELDLLAADDPRHEAHKKSTWRSRRNELARLGLLVRVPGPDGKRYQDKGWRAVWRLAKHDTARPAF